MLVCTSITAQNLKAEQYTFVTFHYPPLEFASTGQTAIGAITEVVRTVMGNLGHDASIKVYPWTRALKMVQKGEVDAIFTAYKNPDREKFLDYSQEVLFPQAVYFYIKSGNNVDFQGNLKTIRDHKIGIVSTISYGQIFEKQKHNMQLDKANTLEQSFHKLLKNRVDLVPSDRNVAEFTLTQMGLSADIQRLPTKIESVPSYIAFSKKRDLQKLRDEFDQELSQLKLSGEYHRILKKHDISM